MQVVGHAMCSVGEPLAPFAYEAVVGSDQALVEVYACGVCHTDLSFLDDGVPTRHPLPLILGHEVSGTVVEVGADAPAALVGTQVVVPAVLPCGRCDPCARGRGQICRSQVFPGNDAHGGFATHLVVPARYLQPVDLPRGDALARLSVVADAVSTAYQAIARSGLGEGDFAIFVGAGGVGGFGVQIARAKGARVLAIDVDDERLERIAEHGASWTLNTAGRPVKELKREVRALATAEGLPSAEWKVFETSGTAAGQALAFNLLTFGAYLGVVGYHPQEVTLRLSNLMAFDARAEGSWGCHPNLYPEALELVTSGAVQLEPFVELFPMSEINDVLDRIRSKRQKRRPVLIPDWS